MVIQIKQWPRRSQSVEKHVKLWSKFYKKYDLFYIIHLIIKKGQKNQLKTNLLKFIASYYPAECVADG